MAFLADNCTFCELTSNVLADCRPFSCGNDDLDDFFANDATRYDTYGENPLGKLGGPKDRRSRCGGSWMTSRLQSHYVSFFRPWDRFDNLGFRLVLNVDE